MNRKTGPVATGDSAGMTDFQSASLNSLAAFNTTMAENTARLYREWTEFMSHRLREDMALRQRLLSCTSGEDMAAVQAAFFKDAMEEYAAESRKMLQMTQDMMQDALAKLKG